MAIQIKKALIPLTEVSAPLLDEPSIPPFCQESSTNCIFDDIYESEMRITFIFAIFVIYSVISSYKKSRSTGSMTADLLSVLF